MKVLLIKDVYKLGHAGDIKKVADGFGRNFLIPKSLAVLATAGAIKKADVIREKANANRMILNKEMGGLAEKLASVTLTFSSKAGETGKLYGSITSQMIVDGIDPVGDLSRDVISDNDCPKDNSEKNIWRDYLDNCHADLEAIEALDAAWKEYKATKVK